MNTTFRVHVETLTDGCKAYDVVLDDGTMVFGAGDEAEANDIAARLNAVLPTQD